MYTDEIDEITDGYDSNGTWALQPSASRYSNVSQSAPFSMFENPTIRTSSWSKFGIFEFSSIVFSI
jgi:hypothetical protein